MPKAIRNRLNEMIDDGVPYLDIIQRLGPDGKDLTDLSSQCETLLRLM
jgi:hypothetical protein